MIIRKEKVNMDSEDFEKRFNVSYDNDIIAMQILTPDVMETILTFSKQVDFDFDITIINDQLYLRFATGSMFEVRNFKEGVIPKETLERYYTILKFENDLIELLFKVIKEANL